MREACVVCVCPGALGGSHYGVAGAAGMSRFSTSRNARSSYPVTIAAEREGCSAALPRLPPPGAAPPLAAAPSRPPRVSGALGDGLEDALGHLGLFGRVRLSGAAGAAAGAVSGANFLSSEPE